MVGRACPAFLKKAPDPFFTRAVGRTHCLYTQYINRFHGCLPETHSASSKANSSLLVSGFICRIVSNFVQGLVNVFHQDIGFLYACREANGINLNAETKPLFLRHV